MVITEASRLGFALPSARQPCRPFRSDEMHAAGVSLGRSIRRKSGIGRYRTDLAAWPFGEPAFRQSVLRRVAHSPHSSMGGRQVEHWTRQLNVGLAKRHARPASFLLDENLSFDSSVAAVVAPTARRSALALQ